MKYLSNYAEEAQTKLFDQTGAFFAFSNKQFDEAKRCGVKYASLGAGLICPVDNVKQLAAGLKSTTEEAIKADIAENGIKAIIHRELANHEAQISMCIDDTLGALGGYGITEEQVLVEYKEFYKKCVDNDWF